MDRRQKWGTFQGESREVHKLSEKKSVSPVEHIQNCEDDNPSIQYFAGAKCALP